jgi:hypothetical protein
MMLLSYTIEIPEEVGVFDLVVIAESLSNG